jgi:hypothetical protein
MRAKTMIDVILTHTVDFHPTVVEIVEQSESTIELEGQFRPEDGDLGSTLQMCFGSYFNVKQIWASLNDDEGWFPYRAILQRKRQWAQVPENAASYD